MIAALLHRRSPSRPVEPRTLEERQDLGTTGPWRGRRSDRSESLRSLDGSGGLAPQPRSKGRAAHPLPDLPSRPWRGRGSTGRRGRNRTGSPMRGRLPVARCPTPDWSLGVNGSDRVRPAVIRVADAARAELLCALPAPLALTSLRGAGPRGIIVLCPRRSRHARAHRSGSLPLRRRRLAPAALPPRDAGGAANTLDPAVLRPHGRARRRPRRARDRARRPGDAAVGEPARVAHHGSRGARPRGGGRSGLRHSHRGPDRLPGSRFGRQGCGGGRPGPARQAARGPRAVLRARAPDPDRRRRARRRAFVRGPHVVGRERVLGRSLLGPRPRGRGRRPDDPHLHLGHHRRAQGRDVDPRQSGLQRQVVGAPDPGHAPRPGARVPAAVPRARAHGGLHLHVAGDLEGLLLGLPCRRPARGDPPDPLRRGPPVLREGPAEDHGQGRRRAGGAPLALRLGARRRPPRGPCPHRRPRAGRGRGGGLPSRGSAGARQGARRDRRPDPLLPLRRRRASAPCRGVLPRSGHPAGRGVRADRDLAGDRGQRRRPGHDPARHRRQAARGRRGQDRRATASCWSAAPTS